MLLALALCAILLGSCTDGSTSGDESRAQLDNKSQSQLETTSETQPAADVEAPALTREQADAALQAIRAGLNDPEQVFDVSMLIAKLPRDHAMLFRDDVTSRIDASDYPNSKQLAALLVVDRPVAHRYIVEGLAAGEASSYMALMYDSEVGRELLSEVELEPEDTSLANLSLDLLRTWGGAEPEDVPLLRQLLESEDQTVAYRAMGHLLALGEGGDAEFDALKQAVLGQTAGWVGAIEGIKISGDPRFADVLVPLASQAQLGADGPAADEAEPAGGAGEFSEKNTVRMAAYALTYLPGDQAQLVRRKLLDAQSPRVRWQARLGELLHGNPAPWHDAIAVEGYTDPDLWTALEPPEAVHRELLPLYAAASCSDDALLRFKAANQLNRYNGIASGARAARILARLLEHQDSEQDKSPAVAPLVRLQALTTAGDLRLPQLVEQVTGIMNNDKADSRLYRPAAAYYVLAVGQLPQSVPGPEDKGSDG